MITPFTLLIIGYLCALLMAFVMGANDASNPTETAVGSGALTIRQALILFAIFVFLGAVLQGYMVMKTIGKGVVSDLDLAGALAAVIGAVIWVLVASYAGMPISTTQSAVGAVIGVGIAKMLFYGGEGPNLSVVSKILMSWVVSPLVSITLAIVLYYAFKRLYLHLLEKGKDVSKVFRWFLIANLAFSAYAFGANDVGNATGAYITVTSKYLGMPGHQTMLFLAVLGAIGIAMGGFAIGHRVISTVAFKVTRLDYVSGSAAEMANALAVWLFTTIPHMLFGYGLPISTTHASVSAVIGVGIAKYRGLRGVNLKTVTYIIMSWVLTLPVSMALGFTLYLVFRNFIPY